MNHYDALGVGKSASPDEIKRAYRKRAHKTHPDKGGKPDDFHAVQRAWDTLSDEARRSHYDATGEDQSQQSAQEQALAQVGNLFMQIIDQVDTDHTNVIAEMTNVVKSEIAKAKGNIQDTRRAIVKREKAVARIKRKKAGANVLEQMLFADIGGKKRAIATVEEKIRMFEIMLEIIGDYDYQADVRTGGGPLFQTIARWSA